jgi:hypothetical protein
MRILNLFFDGNEMGVEGQGVCKDHATKSLHEGWEKKVQSAIFGVKNRR